ncbi:MAG: glycosyltransferase family 2 protein [Pyrobaculum sp.]
MAVKASIIWLNYNSMRFKDVVLQSLDSFLNLDYDGYELVVVDNASSDGSFEIVKRHVEERKPGGLRVKVVRNEVNLGYAGGMNRGWSARDPDSKYVAFVNNDFIAEPDSLSRIIDFLEGEERAVAASGLVAYPDGRIYSAGWAIDELLTALNICNGVEATDCPTASRAQPVTYADGSYYVAKAKYIHKYGFDGRPFIDETFLYSDDSLLSLRLWNYGLRSYYVPVRAGVHFISQTTKGLGMINYYVIRAKFIAYRLVETKYSIRLPLYYFRIREMSRVLCKLRLKNYCTMYKAVVDGNRIGKKIRSLYGPLQLKKAPYVPMPSYLILLHTFLPVRSMFMRSRFITHDMLKADGVRF